jgi:hypothetical protein
MPDHSGHPIGNRDPNRRGLNKEIRNKSRAKRRDGCPFLILVVLAGCAATVASGWVLAQQLFG